MDADVERFLQTVTSPVRRQDADTLITMMGRITGEQPRMWGPSIIGFGHYHYRYASGREGDAGAAGFSPRKAATTIYLPDGTGAYSEPLERLGPHSSSVGCLYVKDLSKLDLSVLEEIVAESYRTLTTGTYTHRAHDHR
jgi:hypothetical protein